MKLLLIYKDSDGKPNSQKFYTKESLAEYMIKNGIDLEGVSIFQIG